MMLVVKSIIVSLQFRWVCPPLPALSGSNQDAASPCVDPDEAQDGGL